MKKTSILLVLSTMGLLLASCGEEQSSVAPSSEESTQTSEILSSEPEPEPSSEPEFSLDPSIFGENAADPFADYVAREAYLPTAKSMRLGTRVSILNGDYRSKGLLVTVNEGRNVGFYSLIGQKYIIPNSLFEKYMSYSVVTDANMGFFLDLTYRNVRSLYDAFGNVLAEDFGTGSSRTVNSVVVDEVLYYQVRIVSATSVESISYFMVQEDGKVQVVDGIPDPVEEEEVYEGPEPGDLVDFGENDQFNSYGAMDLGTMNPEYEGWHLHWNKGSFYTVNDEGVVVARFYIDVKKMVGWNNRGIVTQQKVAVGAEDEVFDYIEGDTKFIVKHALYDVVTGAKTELDLDVIVDNVLPFFNESGVCAFGLMTGSPIDPETKRVIETGRKYLVDGDMKILEDVTVYAPAGFIRLPNGNFFNTATKVLYDAEMKEICSLGAGIVTLRPEAKGFLCQADGKYGFVDYNGKAVTRFVYDSAFDNDGHYQIFRKGYSYVSVDLLTGKENDIIPTELTTIVIGNGHDCVYRGYSKDGLTLYYYDIAGNKLLETKDSDHMSSPATRTFGWGNENYLFDTLNHNVEEGTPDEPVYKTDREEIVIGLFNLPFGNITPKGEEVPDHIVDGSIEYPYVMKEGDNDYVPNIGETYTYFEFAPTTTAWYHINLYDKYGQSAYNNVYYYEKVIPEEGNPYYVNAQTTSYHFDDYDAMLGEYIYSYYAAAFMEEGKTYRVMLSTYAYSYLTRSVTLSRAHGMSSYAPELADITGTTNTMKLTSVRGNVYGRITVDVTGIYSIALDDEEKYDDPELNFNSGIYVDTNKYYLKSGVSYDFTAHLIKGEESTLTFTRDTAGYDEDNPLNIALDGEEGEAKVVSSGMPLFGMIPAANNVGCPVTLSIKTDYSASFRYWTNDPDAYITRNLTSGENAIEMLVTPGEPIHFRFVSNNYMRSTVTFKASVSSTVPTYDSDASAGLWIVGKGSFVTGEEEWSTSTGIVIHGPKTPGEGADLGVIRTLTLQSGDIFKITDGDEVWLGFGAMGPAQDNPIGRANFASDGNDGNIKCLVSGTYDIFINADSQIFITAHEFLS